MLSIEDNIDIDGGRPPQKTPRYSPISSGYIRIVDRCLLLVVVFLPVISHLAQKIISAFKIYLLSSPMGQLNGQTPPTPIHLHPPHVFDCCVYVGWVPVGSLEGTPLLLISDFFAFAMHSIPKPPWRRRQRLAFHCGVCSFLSSLLLQQQRG